MGKILRCPPLPHLAKAALNVSLPGGLCGRIRSFCPFLPSGRDANTRLALAREGSSAPGNPQSGVASLSAKTAGRLRWQQLLFPASWGGLWSPCLPKPKEGGIRKETRHHQRSGIWLLLPVPRRLACFLFPLRVCCGQLGKACLAGLPALLVLRGPCSSGHCLASCRDPWHGHRASLQAWLWARRGAQPFA